MQLMLQAASWDCLALDPFAFEEDSVSKPEVDVSRGKIVDALVITGIVVVRHEGCDPAFEIAGQVVVLKQDAVLERLMPSARSCPGSAGGVVRGAADVLLFSACSATPRDPLRRITRRYPTEASAGGHLIEL